MFKTMTAAGEGRARIQPLNGLEELLSLPARAEKKSGALTPNADDMESSSFTQMFAEDLLLLTAAAGPLPLREANALPLVAEKAAGDLNIQLTTITRGEGPLPKPLVNGDFKGNEESLPAARGIVPNITSFLPTAAPLFLGAVPGASEGKDDKLPSSDEAEDLLLDKVIESVTKLAASAPLNAQPEKSLIANKQATDVSVVASSTLLQPPPQMLDTPGNGAPQAPGAPVIALPLPPAGDGITNQVTASVAFPARTERGAVADKLETTEVPVAANRTGVAISSTLPQPPAQGAETTDLVVQAPRMTVTALSLPPAADDITNQVAVVHREVAEPLGGKDVHLSRNVRESLVKIGLEEFVVPEDDVKQGPAIGDIGKPHAKERFNAPGTMDTYVNAVTPLLSKGQGKAVPTGAIMEQVAAQLPQVTNKGSGRIRISLVPDSLGKLDMDMVVRENRVQIVITAESRIVQQTLQGHVEQLKEALQQQGVEVDGFYVLLQNGRNGQAGGGNPFLGGYNLAVTDQKGIGNDSIPAKTTPFASGQNLKEGAEGINIFI